jgi:dihydroorotase
MAKVLIKKATLVNQESKYNGKVVDILVINDRIEEIKSSITPPVGIRVITGEDLYVSSSWIDIGAYVGEPGHEYREDFESLVKAARVGGYGTIATLPTTSPSVQTKASVQYILNKAKELKFNLIPLASLSENNEGKEITEMLDLHYAGAAAFTDGLKPVTHTGLMARALEYVKQFEGLIIHHPYDKMLSPDAQMHEGEASTMLGMRGAPYISETLMLKRDIDLLTYTKSRLCAHAISCGDSVKLIKDAKKGGANIMATVPYLNLIKTDQDLMAFDSNLKVQPPLRGKSDISELVKGLKEGTIDAIVSNHYPIEEEGKKLEYPYAKFGASGIETCFAALNTFVPNLDTETLVERLTTGPASILGVTIDPIAVGERANLTVFDKAAEWTFDKSVSLSANNPLLGKKLVGKVIEVVS